VKTKNIVQFSILIFTTVVLISASQSCDPDCFKSKDYKPNIYIYPEETTQLKVSIDFPQGGKVLTSIPDYGDGWDVLVDTSGVIDNEFTFLFYESIQPDVWQKEYGWVIAKADLESFFKKNMADYGFEGQEIQDFIDYWIPRLNAKPFYRIFPQTASTIDEVITLNFSEEPDRLLRLHYVVESVDEIPNVELKEPEIELFERKGFFVTEWGVIL